MASDAAGAPDGLWSRIIRAFEHAVVVFLMLLLMIVTSLAAIELAWLLLRDLSSTRELLLDPEELLQLFGFFLLVLVGVELLTALKVYVRSGMIHVEVVLEVALIAIAQKVIVLDTSRAGVGTLLGEAAIIIAPAVAYRSVRA